MTHQLNFIYNDSDWVCPNEYPDLRHAKEIAIDLETKDPNIMDMMKRLTIIKRKIEKRLKGRPNV